MDLDNPSYFATTISDLLKRPRPPSDGSDCSSLYCRHFFRSISADSNHELLIMGEPRLSDIAPDLQPSSRSNSLKSGHKPTVLYKAVPESDEWADELSGDEVFVNEERKSAHYYNYGARGGSTTSSEGTGKNQRRHSIGTFIGGLLGRERTASNASSSAQSDAIVHATSDGEPAKRHGSYSRNKNTMRSTTKHPSSMDDILIFSLRASEGANLWVDYFTSYFHQISRHANRKSFKIQYHWAEECLTKTAQDAKSVIERSVGVKLQLIVICPLLLDFIAEHSDKCREQFQKLFQSDRTQALLLGVTDNDLTDLHKQVFANYGNWQRMSVGRDQDENFTKEFLGQAMTIFSKIWKQQSLVGQEKNYFSVSPKKIRQGQNSVFILLNYPLQKDDVLKVSIERNNELIEVKTVKRRNPYTVKINVPDCLTETTAIVNILVEQNGRIVGSRPIKCESRLRELEQILRLTDNPMEFMCQSLGFNQNNREQVDNWLHHAFQRNMPAHFNLLAAQETPFAASIHAYKQSHEEFPTLLHFAGKFGFEKLAMQLLDCPGADIASETRNVYDMTPTDLAESNGHIELATTMRGYMNINEFTNTYAKLKAMSLKSPESPEIEEEGYMIPKSLFPNTSLDSSYKICPAPRPIEQHFVYNSSPPNSPNGYMAMNKTPRFPTVNSISEVDEMPDIEVQPPSPQTPTPPKPQPVVTPNTSINCVEDKVQKELLEIIYDFKNNVHSIAQVEKLVEEWKNRNDVQKSFQEKQDQLRQMRQRFEQIQQEMKSGSKRASPFDRIRRLFGRSNSKMRDEKEVSMPLMAPATIGQGPQRPISSLSTSSSGSSGRMSTISGSSIGDSGTHSDNEERKNNLMGFHNEDDFRKVILELNYSQVPAPKPIKPILSTFAPIEEKPVIRSEPAALKKPDEYYVQFPPSGKPIPGVEDRIIPGQVDYMNVAPNVVASSISIIKNPTTGKLYNDSQDHEYMNFKADS